MRPTPGESGSQPFLRDRINTRYRAICGSKKVGWKTGQKSDHRRTAEEGLQKKTNSLDAGGVVSTSRADATSMQLPCRGKLLYVCTAAAGEDCQDTELSLDEKPWLILNLFQYVKVHKSQYLSGTQNAQIITELSGASMRFDDKTVETGYWRGWSVMGGDVWVKWFWAEPKGFV
jgi:hypothetical protein